MKMSGASTIAAVGLFSSGLAAGLTAAYPLIINKVFQDPHGQSVAQRLVIWNKGYQAGMTSIPFTAFGAAACYLIGAYRYPLIGSVKQASIISSLLHLAIIPFTLLFIGPVNSILIGMRKKAEVGTSTYTESDVEPLFSRWVFLHNCRCALTCAAFAVGLGNVLGAFA